MSAEAISIMDEQSRSSFFTHDKIEVLETENRLLKHRVSELEDLTEKLWDVLEKLRKNILN